MIDALVRLPAIVLDVIDLERSAIFWGKLLGVRPGKPRSGGDYLTVGRIDGGPLLVLQKVPQRKTTKNRMHLDFTVNDVAAAAASIQRLGGTALSNPLDGGGMTMADPDGNEFCIGAFVRSSSGQRMPI